MTDCPNKVTARAGKEPVFNWSEQSEVKMLLLVVELWREISLINLLHLAPITGPTTIPAWLAAGIKSWRVEVR